MRRLEDFEEVVGILNGVSVSDNFIVAQFDCEEICIQLPPRQIQPALQQLGDKVGKRIAILYSTDPYPVLKTRHVHTG